MSTDSVNAAPVTAAHKARLMRLATYASVSVALTLVVLKAFAWSVSGSVSLLATLVDSALDCLASLLNLLAVHHSLSPADREHRFGHGKYEALSGLGQAVFIAGSAVFLLVEATRRLLHPVAPESWDIGVLVMLVSIGLTFALVLFQRHVVRVTDSPAIRADALHFRADLLVNASVVLALLLAAWGWPGFDALFAAAIALYILASVKQILAQSVDHLMDRELPEGKREKIKRIALDHPGVLGLHDLRSRRAGRVTFIQFHLELADELSLMEAHRIADEVEARLLGAFPGADILIHTDPASVAAEEEHLVIKGES
tara:strand:+ start:844 stop:1785 length:942 start_codon:yes stop_codon:yes gene_type:complete